MSVRALLERFAGWRAAGRPLVLATVIDTSGSTYSKAGHRILIAGTDEWQGLVSGGCLEGDLALHAEEVLAGGGARLVTYDLRAGATDVFGLGVGCDGWLRILLQPLEPARQWEPFTTIARCLADGPAAPSLVVTAAGDELRAGATLIGTTPPLGHDLDAAQVARLLPLLADTGATPSLTQLPGSTGGTALRAWLRPLPRLLVLGAGADAAPLVTLGRLLDYHVTVYDHRPASTARPELAAADLRITAPAGELATRVPLGTVDAAVVMSHHLDSDRAYLQALARSPVPAIALLGPRGRRDRLLQELASDGAALAGRLRAPAGLDLGADTPAGIALAIVAELCARRSQRSARPLSEAQP